MSTTQKPGAAEGQAESTAVKAFFATGKDKKERVALFLDEKNPEWNGGRPAMYGKIDGKSVSVFVEPAGEKDGKAFGAFLTINERGAANGDGTYAKDTKLGKGNLVVTAEGHARLAIKIGEETVWATPRKEVSTDLMAKGGLDVEKLATVRAEVAAKAANQAGNKAPAP